MQEQAAGAAGGAPRRSPKRRGSRLRHAPAAGSSCGTRTARPTTGTRQSGRKPVGAASRWYQEKDPTSGVAYYTDGNRRRGAGRPTRGGGQAVGGGRHHPAGACARARPQTRAPRSSTSIVQGRRGKPAPPLPREGDVTGARSTRRESEAVRHAPVDGPVVGQSGPRARVDVDAVARHAVDSRRPRRAPSPRGSRWGKCASARRRQHVALAIAAHSTWVLLRRLAQRCSPSSQ